MKLFFKACAILAFSLAINSCQKQISKPDVPDETHQLDSDAKNFFNKVQIEDTSITHAIDNLVKQLKVANLWNKFNALYPMVGGTANNTKWNLKDPRDIDASFRLSFHGTPVFAPTGVLFPTTNDYADTHLYDTLLNNQDNAISYFSRTENTVDGYDMGCSDDVFPYNKMAIFNTIGATDYFGFFNFQYMPVTTVGLFMLSATAQNIKSYENGIPKFEKGGSPGTEYSEYPILIGYVLKADSGGKRECSFATIGKGLTDAEALTFSNIVHEFNNRLSR